MVKFRILKFYGWIIWNLVFNILIKFIFDFDLFWILIEGYIIFEKKNFCYNMKIFKIKDFNFVLLIEDIKCNLILLEFFSWLIFWIFKVIFKFFFIILGFKFSIVWIKILLYKYINYLILL